MYHFYGKILILGFGDVARCLLPLLIKHINIPLANIIIIDPRDNRKFISYLLPSGIGYDQQKLTIINMDILLKKYLTAGDILVDLAWAVGSLDLAHWCYEHNVLYLGSSLERWENEYSKKSLYQEQVNLSRLIQKINHKGPTAVFQHGANPGLVSHFMKEGLNDLAIHLLPFCENTNKKLIESYLANDNFSFLAQVLGVKVIHISEHDTQMPKDNNVSNGLFNTWSIEAFSEEMLSNAELSFGTHEKSLPHSYYHFSNELCSQIYVNKPGADVYMKSWTPTGPMTGMVIRHDETYTIANHLTIVAEETVVYRPTVCFVYRPNLSLPALKKMINNNKAHAAESTHILTHEIEKGADEIGVLLMGHTFNSWWTGSQLSIESTRQLAPGYNNSTVLQVACSLLAAFIWILKNPNKGFNIPEDLPYKEILKIAKPYLGTYFSKPVNWTPYEHPQECHWQIADFLIETSESIPS